MFTVALCLSLLPFIAAQGTLDTEFKAIQAHFSQSAVVPQLLPAFNPTALLELNFPDTGDVTPGQKLTKENTAGAPTLTLTPANSTVTFSGAYTVFMVDADIVGTATGQVNKHWLVNGATVANNAVSIANAQPITAYAGPGPAAGSGAHRYVVLVYQQPEAFNAPTGFSEPSGVTLMNFANYVRDSGLGPLVAGTYVTVEDGTASVTVSSTAAVQSSTLAPSSSPTGSTTGTGTRTGTTGAPNATSTGTPGNSAVRSTVPWAAAALAVFGAVMV